MRNMLSIFGKVKPTMPEETPESRLAAALYGRIASRPAPPPGITPKPPPPIPKSLRARLLFGFDATASREAAWGIALPLTDAVLTAMPDQLDVALAVHSGSKVKIFTDFRTDIAKLRDRAAGVRCEAGETRLLDILTRALAVERLACIVYVGDVFEESDAKARKLAMTIGVRGVRLIILLDEPFASSQTGIFAEMAALSGGCVLPFDASSIPRMRDLLSAVGVLAVGGTEMLEAKQETVPAARLLLAHLKGNPK